jgi:hypothetical protein
MWLVEAWDDPVLREAVASASPSLASAGTLIWMGANTCTPSGASRCRAAL